MTTAAAVVAEEPRLHYLNESYGVRSWLLTTDHKRVGLLYLISQTGAFFVGGFFAVMVRLELLTPAGDLLQAETYNKFFTMHGVIMVFFFLIPSIPAALGNFVLPLMIGARDVAFPRLNLASWYLYVLGASFTTYAVVTGGVDTGWTFYTPYSTMSSTTQVMPTAIGIFIVGFSSILTGLNFIVTIHRMRARGLTWFRLPLFVWSLYATSLIQILATPVLAITVLLLGLERVLRVGIFDPALGGDPVLFQHLFWFYSHPAVYIMILPGMGVISELVPCFARKRIFGYRYVAFTSVAIAVFGFLVWGHHLFVAGQSVYAAMVFSLLSYLVAIPSAVKVFNWTATLVIFVGFNLTFFPQFSLGYLGMARRYHAYPDEFQVLNVMSTAGASSLGVGYLLPMIYLLWSLRYGEPAGDNPWDATGLEWRTPSPPPRDNFATAPTVSGEPYAYPGREPVHG